MLLILGVVCLAPVGAFAAGEPGAPVFETRNYTGRPHLPRGLTGSAAGADAIWRGTPQVFQLLRIHPNPLLAGRVGKIHFSLPTDEHVSIRVFDIQGRVVRTLVEERRTAGEYEDVFDTTTLPGGVYFYRLQAGPYADNGRVVVVQ